MRPLKLLPNTLNTYVYSSLYLHTPLHLSFYPSLIGTFNSPWPWIDPSGVYHVLTHDGNGATSAGGHAYSLDGVSWVKAPMAYTGNVTWANGSNAILARRERPQVLLSNPYGSSYGSPQYLFTSGQSCLPAQDFGPTCRSFTFGQAVGVA